MSKRSSDGSVGWAIIFVLFLIGVVPKSVWIGLGITVAIAVTCWLLAWSVEASDRRRAEKQEQARVAQAELTAAAARERAETARRERQLRVDNLGRENAAHLEFALGAVQRVAASEAARAGWLGDVDFSADVEAITANFEKVHALRGVASRLSALDTPSADDCRLFAEAMAAADELERAGIERVELIERCAQEAELIDKSLDTEREDARVAEQRAEIHSKLSAMLYGIEVAPDFTPTHSAVDAVMARVAAYREIKNQVGPARDQ
jgi:hypothetical protein